MPYLTASATSVSLVPTVTATQPAGGVSHGRSPFGIGVFGGFVASAVEAASVAVGVIVWVAVSVGIGTGWEGSWVAVGAGVATATSPRVEPNEMVSS